MPFPTRWQREEDLWLVCLFRGAAKGPALWWFFGAPLWMAPRPPPPAYSCRGAPCAWNLNEAAGPADGAAPVGRSPAAHGPALCEQLGPSEHGHRHTRPTLLSPAGPNAGSHRPRALAGVRQSAPHFPPRRLRGARPWLTWLPTGSAEAPPPPPPLWFQLF